MNKEIVKEIDYSKVCVDDQLSKSITVKVDSGLLNNQERLTNELIDVGYNDIIRNLTYTLNRTVKYIKKVDLNKPFKQNIMGKIFEVDIELDLCSSTTMLFEQLKYMVDGLYYFELLFNRLDEIEKDFNDMIKNNNFKNTTIFNQTTLLAELEGLKHLKLSLISLYNCYGYVLKNPQIKSFFIKWLEHKKKSLCQINKKYDKEVSELNRLILSKIDKI